MWNEYAITDKDHETLSPLIPPHFLKALKNGRISGTVTLNDEPFSPPVVGVLLFSKVKRKLEIEWVALTSSYDMPYYGIDLVRRFTYSAMFRGIYSGVYARFREEDSMSQYFPGSDFVRYPDMSNVVRFTLADADPDRLLKTGVLQKYCVPLKDTNRQDKDGIFTSAAKSGKIIPLSKSVDWNQYDGDVSVLYIKDHLTEGAILTKKDGEDVVLSLLFSTDPMVTITLIRDCFERATGKYGSTQTIICPVINDVSMKLLEKIVTQTERPTLIRAEREFAPLPVSLAEIEKYATGDDEAEDEEEV